MDYVHDRRVMVINCGEVREDEILDFFNSYFLGDGDMDGLTSDFAIFEIHLEVSMSQVVINARQQLCHSSPTSGHRHAWKER